MPVACPEGSCKRQDSQFWRYNVAAHYAQAHPSFAATPLIVEAVQLLIAPEDAEPAASEARCTAALAVAAQIPAAHSDARAIVESIAKQRTKVITLCGAALVPTGRRKLVSGPEPASAAAAGAPTPMLPPAKVPRTGSSGLPPGLTPVTCPGLGGTREGKRRAGSSPPRSPPGSVSKRAV